MKKGLLIGATGIIIVLVLTVLAFHNLFVAPGRSNPYGDPAGFEAFLKLDHIQGDSQDPKHLDEIQIVSFSWAGTQGAKWGGPGGGLNGGVSDFHFTMNVSKASPQLFQASCKGTNIRTAVLTVRRASDKKDFLKFTLSNVKITSYATAGNVSSDASPTDQVSISFTRVEIWEQSFDPEGNPSGSYRTNWDFTYGRGY